MEWYGEGGRGVVGSPAYCTYNRSACSHIQPSYRNRRAIAIADRATVITCSLSAANLNDYTAIAFNSLQPGAVSPIAAADRLLLSQSKLIRPIMLTTKQFPISRKPTVSGAGNLLQVALPLSRCWRRDRMYAYSLVP